MTRVSSSVDAVELTQHFVQLESTSRGAGQSRVFGVAETLLRSAGFEIHADSTRPARYLLATTRTAGSKMLFACHVDTVPVEHADQWTYGPTSGHIAGGRLFGRGASDMKSGLAAALVAILSAGPDGPPSAILLTTNEEIGCLGAAASLGAVAGQNVAAIVVPESTDNKIFLGHRGTSWLRLTVHGRAAHAGTPHLGSNALLTLASALIDLADNGPWWRQKSEIGATTINVATMLAGTATNIVPEAAEAAIDVRAIEPGVPESIRAWLAERHPTVFVATELDLPPVSTARSDAWITSLPGDLAQTSSVPYFTDAAELIAACPDVPIAIWGPGQAELAHCRNESVSVDRIVQATELYQRALGSWPRPDTPTSEERQCR